MDGPTKELNDYIRTINNKGKSYEMSLSVRWSAQKPAVLLLMQTTESLEIRTCMEHSIRIKFQAALRQEIYKITGTPYSTGESKAKNPVKYDVALEKLTEEQIGTILPEWSLDWQLDCIERTSSTEVAEQKKAGAALMELASAKGFTTEQLLELMQTMKDNEK